MELCECYVVVVLAEVLEHELIGLEGKIRTERVPAPPLVVRHHVVTQIAGESDEFYNNYSFQGHDLFTIIPELS